MKIRTKSNNNNNDNEIIITVFKGSPNLLTKVNLEIANKKICLFCFVFVLFFSLTFIDKSNNLTNNTLLTKQPYSYIQKQNENFQNYPCELKRDFNKRYMCTISDLAYRRSYDKFIFDLLSVNEFGRFEEKFEIDHFNIGK